MGEEEEGLNPDMISERTKNILIRCLEIFDAKFEGEEDGTGESIKSLIREFGIQPDEIAALCDSMCQYYMFNSIGMRQGVRLAMLVGMMLGRECENEIRSEVDKFLDER